jgi:hypothetical protein
MTSGSSTGYGFNELAGMLLAAAGGLHTSEAAAELVIAHQTWLFRTDFTTTFITVTHDDDGDGDGYADINWSAALDALDAGLLPCSGSEANMLRIAASLAGPNPITIGTAVSGLDTRNVTLVLNAIAHASGYRNTEVSLG